MQVLSNDDKEDEDKEEDDKEDDGKEDDDIKDDDIEDEKLVRVQQQLCQGQGTDLNLRHSFLLFLFFFFLLRHVSFFLFWTTPRAASMTRVGRVASLSSPRQ